MADKYVLRVTAGPSYDAATHVEVPVNDAKPISIKGDGADIELNVRIQNYNGLPLGSPRTSAYFATEPHACNQDQYSISFRFAPRKRASAGDDDSAAVEATGGTGRGISGHDLQFGNDFDRPIRDRLPPGFNTALSIVRWWIDPGLEGDAYADKPYLYGPALSSFNTLHVGAGVYDADRGGLWFEEGGDRDGVKARQAVGMPGDSKARMKWALKDDKKRKWCFEYGKTYGLDFYNPYLDFQNLALRLPGFHLPIVKYWDGQGLRYVLRNKQTAEVYLVVVFTIYLAEDVNDDGTLKEGAAERVAEGMGVGGGNGSHQHDQEEALREAEAKLGPKHAEEDTNADDVD